MTEGEIINQQNFDENRNKTYRTMDRINNEVLGRLYLTYHNQFAISIDIDTQSQETVIRNFRKEHPLISRLGMNYPNFINLASNHIYKKYPIRGKRETSDIPKIKEFYGIESIPEEDYLEYRSEFKTTKLLFAQTRKSLNDLINEELILVCAERSKIFQILSSNFFPSSTVFTAQLDAINTDENCNETYQPHMLNIVRMKNKNNEDLHYLVDISQFSVKNGRSTPIVHRLNEEKLDVFKRSSGRIYTAQGFNYRIESIEGERRYNALNNY